jgi:hypothetical protein
MRKAELFSGQNIGIEMAGAKRDGCRNSAAHPTGYQSEAGLGRWSACLNWLRLE